MPRKHEPLPTIWAVPDELWAKIHPLLPPEKAPGTPGRPAVPFRQVLDGILYVLRTGCQWNQLPEQFPDDSSVHRTMQRWVEAGVFEQIWVDLVTACADLGGVDWTWQAVDGALQKARLGGITSALTRQIAANQARNAA